MTGQFIGKVLTGNKLGRTLGFPTINLDPSILPTTTKTGVYASLVRIKNKQYLGALFFGPRVVLNESNTVLEIYLLDFNEEIYGETISFSIGSYIRDVENYSSLDALKKRLQKDVEKIRSMTREFSVSSPIEIQHT